ncbi:hypothetical protein FDH38_gp104 [Dinoroseobacter phage vB_DshS-R5C]|uniref:Uncharacterized protein n=1 Tax=Dinoroseobacter phage vB_DshS-R5C TaxID=1965368 RepID=A0A1V0DYE9_9CAUD|nr:hypothetical protein FDH38_gp104 [Dinoroseobacter phage vB_DshS-R5C]ARB06158.1 hypothetical protein vBDshSR5C_104 [Dinoroseobacter phage vB_DshS-R5C]
MQNDPFDFKTFMANATNPDDDTKREHLRDAVSDEMETVMAEVGPRVWAVLYQQMQKDPKNNIHLNAVLNSGIFAILAWVAACTPQGETNGRDNDEVLREKIMNNLDSALANGRDADQAQSLALMAMNVGQMKLLEDACKDLGKVITANSMVIKGVHQTIQNMWKERVVEYKRHKPAKHKQRKDDPDAET